MKSKFEYTLKDPINVAIDGEQIECFDIIVKSPRPKDREQCLILESYIGQALLEFASTDFIMKNKNEGSNNSKKSDATEAIEAIEATEDTEDTEDIEDLISGRKTAILYCSDEKRIRGIINCLRQLFSAGNRENPQATIGGEKFTSPLFDEISYRDISDLIARYSAHFLSLGLK
jgi:hypothetical protein